MYVHETKIRVRYAETDQMGYVYHGNFATYYEVARVEMLREMGFPYKKLEDKGIKMPVLSLKCDFMAPARYDDLITVKVTVTQKPSVKMFFSFEVFNESNVLLNTGEIVLVFLDANTNKPCRCPIEITELFAKYF
ncbi:MAG: acyl-CoA thioesterase [Bacteroidetes bacterium]|nr:MAG: acyl-CoA thioesterase [Bacteroidota bacterium]TAG85491.1 MAG: acyl-CoA thioesterase [Bacteroidota bacterium]